MVKEGTPGKYQLRAVLPGSRRPLIEAYARRDEVERRRFALENTGYSVVSQPNSVSCWASPRVAHW